MATEAAGLLWFVLLPKLDHQQRTVAEYDPNTSDGWWAYYSSVIVYSVLFSAMLAILSTARCPTTETLISKIWFGTQSFIPVSASGIVTAIVAPWVV